MPEEQRNFATTGTETFKLDESQKVQNKDKIVLNIQEEGAKGIIIDKESGGKIVESGNFLLDIYRKVNLYFVSKTGVKTKEKANFYHLLAVMVNSGIPMIRALKSLVAQLSTSPRLQSIIDDLANSIEAGSSLSEAMFVYPKVFSEAEIGMIQSGEASGQLSNVLDNLAADTEKAYMIKSKVKGAMMYPMVIFSLLIIVVAAMMIYVIPKLTSLFESIEGELPLITRIVVGTSDFMVNQKLLLVAIVGGAIVFFMMFKKTDVGRYMIDELKLKIPIFGPLLQKAYLSRFARSLSNLLDSNVSIVKTLEITANSMGNEVYRRRLLLAMEDIKQGIPLAENLSSTELFPPMLVNMIDVGEKTAQLDQITAKVAAFYESEVDTAVAGISKIIEPVILIIIGFTVGGVVASIMLPIMQLSDLSGAL